MSLKTKTTTLIKTVRRVKNWPAVLGQMLSKRHSEVCLVSFREGINAVYRPQTEDWEVVKEVMLYGVYGVCLRYLKGQTNNLPVLDLGANIGLFSLRAARCKPGLKVHAYEPAQRNVDVIQMNLRANPKLSPQIHVHAEAVGGYTRRASFFYDEQVPQGSSLIGAEARGGFL
jgi:2-polyprenyl-3-methyl-5-hydroxy-6-metoxy-1,4-benzoquinol methylase